MKTFLSLVGSRCRASVTLLLALITLPPSLRSYGGQALPNRLSAIGYWLLALAFCLLPSAFPAQLVTLTITITNAPVDGNTLTVNGDVRTWKTTVANPLNQILISSNVATNTTNLYTHIAVNGFTGPLVLPPTSRHLPASNVVTLMSQPGGVISASISGTWAVLTLSTQTYAGEPRAIRVPMSVEEGGSRTNMASQLVSDLSAFSTNAFAQTATALANHVNLTNAQTLRNKTIDSGNLTNVNLKTLFLRFDNTNANGLEFFSGTRVTTIAPDSFGLPTLYDTSTTETPTNEFGSYTPSAGNLLTRAGADSRYGRLNVTANTWTGTNQFQRLTNSLIIKSGLMEATNISGTVSALTNGTYTTPTINAATITGSSLNSGASTISGNVGSFTNGGYLNPVTTNAINRGNPLQSYATESTSLQLGSSAQANASFSIALGNNASATASGAVSIGDSADTAFASSTSLGIGAIATAANQFRLGRSTETVSIPGKLNAALNILVGADTMTFPSGLSGGITLINGTPPSADPTTGVSSWSASGEWKYRTSAANEGSGSENRVHNRAAQVTGSGSDYTFTTSYARADFGGTDGDVTLPTAGTYLITALVAVQSGAVANDLLWAKLYDSTTAADIPSSERHISYLPIAGSGQGAGQLMLQNVHTVTASKVIQIHVKNTVAARGTVTAIETSISYVRLH